MLLQTFGFLQCPQNMGYRQWLQQCALYNTRKFKFTLKRLYSRWLCLFREDFELLVMSSLLRSSGYFATNFICTHLHDEAISVCMHALVGLETLRD